MTTMTIEDEDGFWTEWEWPDDRLALASSDFVAGFERQHEVLRADWDQARKGET